MPEKELIVYLPAASADLAIRELMESHQIYLMVVLMMGAVATVLFAILYCLLKKWIFRKARAAG